MDFVFTLSLYMRLARDPFDGVVMSRGAVAAS